MTEAPDTDPDPETKTEAEMDADDSPDRLPADVADEAERLTRLAREADADGADASRPVAPEFDERERAVDEAAAARRERDALLAEYGYTAREREEGGTHRDSGSSDEGTRDVTLVCYPDEWVEDDTVRFDRIDDTSRAVERPLETATGEADWDAVDEHNRAVAEAVADARGPVHGANARAFAAFMSNHYATPIEEATRRMREEFLTEYFPRNAWPSDDQRSLVEESVDVTVETARD